MLTSIASSTNTVESLEGAVGETDKSTIFKKGGFGDKHAKFLAALLLRAISEATDDKRVGGRGQHPIYRDSYACHDEVDRQLHGPRNSEPFPGQRAPSTDH